jgi:hypothetical protein
LLVIYLNLRWCTDLQTLNLRRNCIYAASGIVTVCRWLSCAPVRKELFFLNRCTGQSPADSDNTRGCIYTITT